MNSLPAFYAVEAWRGFFFCCQVVGVMVAGGAFGMV